MTNANHLTSEDDDSPASEVEFGPVLYGQPDEYHFLHALVQLAYWTMPGHDEPADDELER
jgi:hypothetical protein